MVSFSYKDVSPLGHFYINNKEHKRAKRDLDILIVGSWKIWLKTHMLFMLETPQINHVKYLYYLN